MELRRSVRANLHKQMVLQGTDRWGQPFEIYGESLDFSRRGLGLRVDRDLIAPGSVISVSIPNKFRSNATVQWTRTDSEGKIRFGVHLINPKASTTVRIAASLLLCLALMGQVTFGRSRSFTRSNMSSSTCTMRLDQMKTILEKSLGKYAVLREDEKAFVHLQHQNMTCEEYTRQYEKSDFFSNPKMRAALANWHWTVYHAKDNVVRTAAIQSLESSLSEIH
jgi:hypothetical protein